jgi:hypothetical protein
MPGRAFAGNDRNHRQQLESMPIASPVGVHFASRIVRQTARRAANAVRQNAATKIGARRKNNPADLRRRAKPDAIMPAVGPIEPACRTNPHNEAGIHHGRIQSPFVTRAWRAVRNAG